jgi:hypothetical protein
MALVAITALAALALATAGGVAAHPGKGKGHAKAHAKAKAKAHAKACAKTLKVGFVVSGTLLAYTPDDTLTTADNETVVTLDVTHANRHARHSGEMEDQDLNEEGTQVAGADVVLTFGDDEYILTLEGYEGADTPSVGDFVHVVGKIEVEKKKCADEGTSTEDRYGEVDVRKVIVSDRDADV